MDNISLIRFIEDIKLTVFDNGGNTPHRFELEFSIKPIVGQDKETDQYINFLDHTLICKLGANDGRKRFIEKWNDDDDKESRIYHSAIIEHIFNMYEEELDRPINLSSRIPPRVKNKHRMWYGLSKTETNKGIKMVPFTGAVWQGTETGGFDGMLDVFIAGDMFTFRVTPANFNNVGEDKESKIVGIGRLIGRS
ncbi:hypothetical protein [Psychrosphaera haliotis]|uniref:hypothetical protein n=1 Tax=Psychrosphaera haliotis TaxID=555083 RepID=UPI0031DF1FCE